MSRFGLRLDLDTSDLPGEIWKDFLGYEDSYSVSNMGRVKSKARYASDGRLIKTRILRTRRKKSPLQEVTLYSDGKGKSHTIPRLIFEAFVGQIYENHVVIHIDGDYYNNRFDNLKAVSKLSFIRLIHLQSVIQLDLNDNVIAEFNGIVDIVRRFGFIQSCISEVCLGRRKTAYGFKWKFKDDV